MSETRNRPAADGQGPRRRTVAGQRAAARRAVEAASRPAEPDGDGAPATTAVAVARRPARRAVPVPADRGDQAPDQGADVQPPRPAAGRRSVLIRAALGAATAAALAVCAVLGFQYRDAQRTGQARTAALAEAQKAVPVIFSYDYRHLDQDFAAAEAFLTGPFRDQYAKTTETVVKPTASQYDGVVKATVAKPSDGGAPALAVVSASPDQVVVLAFVDQSTTSNRVSGTQVDQNRVLLTLTRAPGGWLVSAVAAL